MVLHVEMAVIVCQTSVFQLVNVKMIVIIMVYVDMENVYVMMDSKVRFVNQDVRTTVSIAANV